jgi:hypothetical protein
MPDFTLADEPGRGILAVPIVNLSKRPPAADMERAERERTGKEPYGKRA